MNRYSERLPTPPLRVVTIANLQSFIEISPAWRIRLEYFRRAINEYKEAEKQFALAHNQIFRADVINNVGFLLFKLGRYKEAHKYLDGARRLTVRFKDKSSHGTNR